MNRQLPPALIQIFGMAIAVVAVIVWLHTGHASYPITSLALALMLGGRVAATLGITKEEKDDYRVPPSLPRREERRDEQRLLEREESLPTESVEERR